MRIYLCNVETFYTEGISGCRFNSVRKFLSIDGVFGGTQKNTNSVINQLNLKQ